jgi:chromosome partitioning protein
MKRAALAESGQRVLLVDFDPSCQLTDGLGFQHVHKQKPTVYTLLRQRDALAEDAILETSEPRLWLIPSDPDLAGWPEESGKVTAREKGLAKKLDPVLERFDYVLIDCAARIDVMASIAFTASNQVLVPVAADYRSLPGLTKILEKIKDVREADLRPDLRLGGLLLTKYSAHRAMDVDVETALRGSFPSKVYRSMIRFRTALAADMKHHKPVTAYARRSEAAEDFRALARELIDRGGTTTRPASGIAGAGAGVAYQGTGEREDDNDKANVNA